VKRILSTRRHRRLRYADLEAMGARLGRARYFIVASDYRTPKDERGSERLRIEMTQAYRQQSLF
jgi:predicted DNA-binding helix-hairpin-helix protein